MKLHVAPCNIMKHFTAFYGIYETASCISMELHEGGRKGGGGGIGVSLERDGEFWFPPERYYRTSTTLFNLFFLLLCVISFFFCSAIFSFVFFFYSIPGTSTRLYRVVRSTRYVFQLFFFARDIWLATWFGYFS